MTIEISGSSYLSKSKNEANSKEASTSHYATTASDKLTETLRQSITGERSPLKPRSERMNEMLDAFELNIKIYSEALKKAEIEDPGLNSLIESKKKEIIEILKEPNIGSGSSILRNKKDDFGLVSRLNDLLKKADTVIDSKKGLEQNRTEITAKDYIKMVQADTLNKWGSEKYSKPITHTFTYKNEPYTSTIEQKTDTFISSAANTKTPNTCGNLHVQTVKNKTGETVFSQARHAALSAGKNTPGDTQVPGSNNQTAEQIFNKAIEENNSESQKILEHNGIKLSDYKPASKTWIGYFKSLFDRRTPLRTSIMTELKKKFTHRVALKNKAIDLVKSLKEFTIQGNPPSLTISSLSLLTPTSATKENVKWSDQQQALELVQSLSATELKEAGLPENLNITVFAFNFGVNEGEFVGRSTQKSTNKKAIDALLMHTKKKCTQLFEEIKNDMEELNTISQSDTAYNEKMSILTEKQIKLSTMHQLKDDIDQRFKAFSQIKGPIWRADKSYQLVARIAILTDLNGDGSAVNCASGKDRTGMSIGTFNINYALKIKKRMKNAFQELKKSQNVATKPIHMLLTDNLDEIKINLFLLKNNPLFTNIKSIKEEIATLKKELAQETESKFESSKTINKNNGAIKIKEKMNKLTEAESQFKQTDPESYETYENLNILQMENRMFGTQTGQHEIQAKNTGSKGYKLYGQTVTRNQTENLFQKLFGLSEYEVAEQITKDGKYVGT